ncbi:MAG: response regulator [Bacteroidia bacterium]|nr:response regulator [Bacteroidota bacterium]MBP9082069.1 response regulator [Bacteroidia bacterium]MBK7970129.1 response regulator [Bacteroidota bacterium]MBK8414272.1 response regulator [Bacteroidota bacterium]MBK8874068.1 response regulator [Bacteroidota bacterium]
MNTKTALIWLIDDNEIDNFIAASVIKRLPDSPEVIAFTDPLSALTDLGSILSNSQRLPNIILLDVNMPKLSGFEFADRLRELPFGAMLPDIYMLSSSGDRSDIQRAEEHELIKSYIIKPFTSRHLDIILGTTAEGQ